MSDDNFQNLISSFIQDIMIICEKQNVMSDDHKLLRNCIETFNKLRSHNDMSLSNYLAKIENPLESTPDTPKELQEKIGAPIEPSVLEKTHIIYKKQQCDGWDVDEINDGYNDSGSEGDNDYCDSIETVETVIKTNENIKLNSETIAGTQNNNVPQLDMSLIKYDDTQTNIGQPLLLGITNNDSSSDSSSVLTHIEEDEINLSDIDEKDVTEEEKCKTNEMVKISKILLKKATKQKFLLVDV